MKAIETKFIIEIIIGMMMALLVNQLTYGMVTDIPFYIYITVILGFTILLLIMVFLVNHLKKVSTKTEMINDYVTKSYAGALDSSHLNPERQKREL